MTYWKRFIECECSSEGIMMGTPNKEDNTIDLAFFRYGDTYKMRLKDRFRYCFQVLFKGEPYLDQVILNIDSCKELIKELHKFIKNKSIPINLGN